MSGVSRILSVYDDFEVRQILLALKDSKLHVSALQIETPPAETIATLKSACQSLVWVSQLTGRRIKELIQQSLQDRLRFCIESLTKDSPILVSSMKTCFERAKDKDAKESKIQTCQRILKTIHDMEEIVQIREDAPNFEKVQPTCIY